MTLGERMGYVVRCTLRVRAVVKLKGGWVLTAVQRNKWGRIRDLSVFGVVFRVFEATDGVVHLILLFLLNFGTLNVLDTADAPVYWDNLY